MGLKTTDYYVKKLGITLPEAYALISKLEIKGNKAYATFSIQSSRATALSHKPLDTVMISFDVFDKSANLYEMAYVEAKKSKMISTWNAEINNYVQKETIGVFAGWDDDIDPVLEEYEYDENGEPIGIFTGLADDIQT